MRRPRSPRLALGILLAVAGAGAAQDEEGDVRILETSAPSTDASTATTDTTAPAEAVTAPPEPEGPGLPPAIPDFLVGLDDPWFYEAGTPFYGNIFGDFTPARRTLAEGHLREMAHRGIHALRYPIVASDWLGDSLYKVLPSVKHLGLDRPCVLGEFSANAKGTSIPQIVKIVRAKGYTGAWAWCYFGSGYPEDLTHKFSFHARASDFLAAGGGP